VNLIGLMPARNEAWVIGLSARAALRWCDELILLLHACSDDTAAIVDQISAEHPGRVHVLIEPDPDWAEMAHRQRLLTAARGRSATHLALVDADEVLTGNLLTVIREWIEPLTQGAHIQVGMRCMWRSLDWYRSGVSVWSNRWDLALAFSDHPSLKWEKVNGYDHHHRQPFGSVLAKRAYALDGGVMHLQFANWRRLRAKHARYKMMERVKYPGKSIAAIERLYNQALDETRLQTMAAPASHWEPYADLMGHIDLDAEPWQESECRRLMREHGPETFAGLNLFDVVEMPMAVA
jgi:hypothetical protein